MNLERKPFTEVDLADPFFDSLKAEYAEFPSWFAKKATELAYVFYSDNGTLDGFLYVKVEDDPVTDVSPPFAAARRLKIGTMKINPHGTRLGERFVKKVFDHAIFEKVDQIYVTIFPHHQALISLLERYGFEPKAEKTSPNGTEQVLVRVLKSPYDDVVKSYPLVRLNDEHAYLLAIYPKWHSRLLPDSILATEESDVVQDVSHANSIHKVYLAAMDGMDALKRGDVLLIYRTTDDLAPAHYRSVATSVCVVEEYRSIHSFADKDSFLEYCRPYSVFTDAELEDFWNSKKYHHVIRFAYNIAFRKRVTRGEMIEQCGLNPDAYWGFLPITHEQLIDIAKRGLVDEDLIVN